MPTPAFALKRIANKFALLFPHNLFAESKGLTRISFILACALLASAVVTIFAFLVPRTTAKNKPVHLPSSTAMANRTAYDFDGDGKADIGRWHPANNTFEIKRSSDGELVATSIGSSSSIPVPGDYDGDGTWDVAVFTAGTWNIIRSSDGNLSFTLGTAGDIPVSGDYDADGKTDAAVFHPGTSATWNIRYSVDGSTDSRTFGTTGDIPIPGNYGGRATDIAFFRPSTGDWHWWNLGAIEPAVPVHWGAASHIPLQGDFDGDGLSDLVVFNPANGAWYINPSSIGFPGSSEYFFWGSYNDQPAPADYDGDGKADYCVWRPTTGVWHTYFMPPEGLGEGTGGFESSNYAYQTLGVPGDRAIPSAYTKQIGGTVTGYEMATARLAPRNATSGTNLYSQNFSWGTSLVSLPGRSGFNAGFGIGYNSLVWIKSGWGMYFDPDASNVTPGFRFGFPVIEPVYFDSAKGIWAYMMVTPDGARKEFRQQGASNYFETADSGYTQLKILGESNPNSPVEEITITVTTTDGTQMNYVWDTGAYRCTEIKDRNGNFITNAYSEGRLTTMTDTLGRIITVNYGSGNYPASITQTWKNGNGDGSNVTYNWARFDYAYKTVAINFGLLSVYGPPNGTVIKVLEKVTYADDSYTKFTYNGYVQVEKVENYAAGNNLLNHVRTNLDSVSGAQSDCPRFTETSSYAENFNSGTAVTVSNTAPASAAFSAENISEPSMMVRVRMTGHPNELYSRLYFGAAASTWREGLPLASEDCTGTDTGCATRKRWTWTNWEQDAFGGVTPDYVCNPRVKETQVGDGVNTKRSTISYHLYSWEGGMEGDNIALFGLVKEVDVYDSNLSTILKKSVTEYNLNTNYTLRRIIGLPSQTLLYDQNDAIVSKVTYAYDENGYTGSGPSVSPTQHDSGYGTTFAHRGNLTSTTRCDVSVSTETTCNGGVTSSVKYNIAGSPISQKDALDRVTTISYADAWNDNVTRTTYAYPTTLTDPANNSSTIKYRYDIGANVEATSPAPAGNTYGKTSKRSFDSLGRLERESVWVDTTEKLYTRYEYPTNGIQSKVYSTITDTNSNGPDTADEVLTERWTDGAGRVRATRSPHTFSGGTAASWAGTQVRYDILGRVTKQSVPTEVTSAPDLSDLDDWQAAGDDSIRGWLWTHQKYDWMGRVTRKINTDGADSPALNDSDILISYDGCGCAGGLVTTTESERVPIPGTGNYGRRKQLIHQDILGRTYKTEVLNWNGSVYSTSEDAFNGRDQVVSTTQTDGASSTARQVVMTYDGHGRMKTRHYPIEDGGTNTIWNYNADDTIHNVTDPRGVVTTFAYNSRGMVTGISYDPNSTGIADTHDVTFEFDNAGNRTSMTDGTGSTSYVYNPLSQITSETKYVSELNNSYTINYTYALNGAVASYTDPQNPLIKAEFFLDKLGRSVGARNTSEGAVKQELSETQYRAWGALKKHRLITNGLASSVNQPVEFEYDNRLQISRHFAQYATDPSTYFHDVEYLRNADGKVNLSTDTRLPSYTRNFEYDHVGRLTKSLSGKAIHNLPDTETPYRTTIAYNSFSEETNVSGKHWEVNNPAYLPTVSLTTGRVTTATYDAAGNVLSEDVQYVPDPRTYAYDAAGRNTSGVDPGHRNQVYNRYITTTYDGDGRRVKTQTFHDRQTYPFTAKTFEFHSTVLTGETVGKLNSSNSPGSTDATEFMSVSNGVKLTYNPSSGYSKMEWLSPEGTTMYDELGGAAEELDIRGGGVGTENPYNNGGTYEGGGSRGDAENYPRCSWEGMAISCSKAFKIASVMNHLIPNVHFREPQQHALAPVSRPSTTTETDKPATEPANTGAIAPALDPRNFVASLNMDWVYANGQVFFDSRVVDQESATELYGGGAKYYPTGHKYTASDGADIVLGDYGFFTENGRVFSSVDRADTAAKIQAEDHSAWIMSGGLMIAGGLAADDITGIGVVDDPAIPVVITSAVVAALAAKMTYEISKIQERPAGPQGVQYSLRATVSGDYVCFLCSSGTMTLNAGDIWKFGQTINPTTRYTDTQLSTIAGRPVEQFNEFRGNQVEIMMAEKVKIYAYFAARGHLPPGNRIFR